jgi:hypothetical protein
MDEIEFEVSSEIRDSFPDDWPDWVLHCLTRLNDAEAPAEEAFLKDAADWVYTLAADLIKILMPTVKYDPKKQSGPEYLGATIGHQDRLFTGEDSDNAMAINARKIGEAEALIDRHLRENLTEQERTEFLANSAEATAPFRAMAEQFLTS